MNYRLLGRSGLRVAEVCFGALTFGELPFRGKPFGVSREESAALFKMYADEGGNFIDTADIYGEGLSESYVGELVAPERDFWVVASKYSISTRVGDPNAGGNQRKTMVQALERSLKRLKTDRIDLYWVHFWDSLTPPEELMQGLHDLVRSGKVLYIGISNAPAWRVSQANAIAELRGWAAFVGLQIEYSLIQRTPERDLLPMAAACGLSVAAWSPLGGAVLTGKYGKRDGAIDSQRVESNASFGKLTRRNLEIAGAVQALADRLGIAPAQVALAWLLARPIPIIPILGARTLAQLRQNLDALKITLPAEARSELDAMSEVDLGFPHDFLANTSDWFSGGTRARTLV